MQHKQHVIMLSSAVLLSTMLISTQHAHAATVENPMTISQWTKGNPHLALSKDLYGDYFAMPHNNFMSVETIYLGEKGLPRFDAWDIFSGSNGGNTVTTQQFRDLKADGVKGVIVKATEGTGYINPKAQADIDNAQQAGMNVETYHFAWFTNAAEAKAEADYYANELDRLHMPKNDRVVLDLEKNVTANGQTGNNVKTFFDELSNRGYHNHVLYTFVSYPQKNAAINVVGNKNVWMAQYPYQPRGNDLWNTQYGAWQFSSTARFIDVSKHLNIIGNNDVSVDYDGILTTTPASTPVHVPTVKPDTKPQVSSSSSSEKVASSSKKSSSLSSSSSSVKSSSSSEKVSSSETNSVKSSSSSVVPVSSSKKVTETQPVKVSSVSAKHDTQTSTNSSSVVDSSSSTNSSSVANSSSHDADMPIKVASDKNHVDSSSEVPNASSTAPMSSIDNGMLNGQLSQSQAQHDDQVAVSQKNDDHAAKSNSEPTTKNDNDGSTEKQANNDNNVKTNGSSQLFAQTGGEPVHVDKHSIYYNWLVQKVVSFFNHIF